MDHTVSRSDGGSRPSEQVADLELLLLGGSRTLSLAELADLVGVDIGQLALYWHALGQPTTTADAPGYTDYDAVVLAKVLSFSEENELSPRAGVSLVRSAGHSTERLVLWQTEAIVEHITQRYGVGDAAARRILLNRLDIILPILETQLLHAWRRQMMALIERLDAEFGVEAPTSTEQFPLARAIWFADIVSFTHRTAHFGPHELSDFIESFETTARDIVTEAGGRVVKTVGDAVLYVADSIGAGAEVSLGLAERFGEHSTSPVRVGLVWGRILSRFGDVFGPTVNLATRLSDAADPGGVLVDPPTAAALTGHRRTVLIPRDEQEINGFGTMAPVELRRG